MRMSIGAAFTHTHTNSSYFWMNILYKLAHIILEESVTASRSYSNSFWVHKKYNKKNLQAVLTKVEDELRIFGSIKE